MPPRRNPPNNRVLCTCVTHKCGTKQYWVQGAWRRGQLIVAQAAHRHQVDDQAHFEETTPKKSSTAHALRSSPGSLGSSRANSPTNRSEAFPASSGPEDEFAHPPDHQGPNKDCNHGDALAAVTHSLSSIRIGSPQAQPGSPNGVYDTSKWMTFPFTSTPPSLTYGILIATMLAILQPTSDHTSAWVLRSQRNLIELVLSHQLRSSSSHRSLTTSEESILQQLPADTRSTIKWLKLDPILLQLNCCPKCFAMYPLTRTPNACINSDDHVPDPADDDLPDTEKSTNLPHVCGEPLFHLRRSITTPIRRFTYQCLNSWIARLLTRPGIEDALDRSLTCSTGDSRLNISAGLVSDVHDSSIWSEFKGPDGQPFTARSGNLVFGFFIDAINPYGNKQAGKHASITFMALVCISLPFDMRFLPENLFLVGIAPGPKEPSLTQTNWILKPMVQQLNHLWSCGLSVSSTHRHPGGRHVMAALLPTFGDLPALRRALGFPGHSANKFMCSFCDTSKSNINNLEVNSWKKRTSEHHVKWAHAYRDAETSKERAQILKIHGVRYSVLTELPYWKPNEYQTVDAMHNLLLGLLKWHCVRFWGMSEKAVNEDYRFGNSNIPISEVNQLADELTSNDAARYETRSTISSETEDEDDTDSPALPFLQECFGTNTSTSDTNWEAPDPSYSGWDGRWTAGSVEDITLDSEMLRLINAILPRIHHPTWIKRAIPILGKAANGKLKADEWRNLFLMQLPLILVKAWYGRNRANMSLLYNFMHLVSAVNLALKRSMTPERIKSYSHHIKEYLSSSIVLFPECSLAPNHHMSMHLGECLARFGPVRAWWSFPMERLMGQVLHSSHNNRLGQLEATFLRGFCRAGNLRGLLAQSDFFPKTLQPYIAQLQNLYEDPTSNFSSKYLSHPLRSQSLSSEDSQKLVDYLNAQSNNCSWAVASDWANLSKNDQRKIQPLPSRCQLHQHMDHKNVTFSTWEANPNNSVIYVKESFPKILHFARIDTIFSHSRTTNANEKITDTWLKVKSLPPIPKAEADIYSKLQQPHLQLFLRLPASENEHILNINDIVSHCAWIEYASGEINSTLNYPTIGLVSLDRD